MPDINQLMNENDLIIAFPTNAEWEEIYAETNIGSTLFLIQNILNTTSKNTTSDLFDILEIRSLGEEIYHRFFAAARSFILLTFYFKKGIPDNEVGKRNEVNGPPVYFPDFESQHYEIKSWFDYYCDNFYFKLFAGLNSIGHILNKCFEINMKNPDFGTVMKKFISAKKNSEVQQKFLDITESPQFKFANKIRNDIAHNFLPNAPGSFVVRSKGLYPIERAYASKPYINSGDIFENCRASLLWFENILELTIDLAITPYFPNVEPPCPTENKSN